MVALEEGSEREMMREIAEYINILGEFCGPRDVDELTGEALLRKYAFRQADVMVLFGGSVLCGGDVLAAAIQEDIAGKYIIAGGHGHTTPDLRDRMRELFPSADFSNMQEAEMFDAYIGRRYGLHADFLETKSTNCGSNITNLLNLLDNEQIKCESIILTQDATMQRRMFAGMKKHRPQMRIINYAAYRATVVPNGQALTYASRIRGMWDTERYVSLLMGEIKRLTDDRDGYGPRGAGYIAHVDIPENVREAFVKLKEHYQVREANPEFASF